MIIFVNVNIILCPLLFLVSFSVATPEFSTIPAYLHSGYLINILNNGMNGKVREFSTIISFCNYVLKVWGEDVDCSPLQFSQLACIFCGLRYLIV